MHLCPGQQVSGATMRKADNLEIARTEAESETEALHAMLAGNYFKIAEPQWMGYDFHIVNAACAGQLISGPPQDADLDDRAASITPESVAEAMRETEALYASVMVLPNRHQRSDEKD